MLIVGASGRAAAWSALRAGLSPVVIDLFADADLALLCPAVRIDARNYPHGLVAAAENAPRAPFLYTGALENHRAVVADLARRRPLWGNPPEVLKRVRSPENLAAALEQRDLPFPRITAQPAMQPNMRWLSKPRRGASGEGIRFWAGAESASRRYFQEWIDGESCAAIFIADAKSRASLVGVTRQLIGMSWLNCGGFRYCGSIGPIHLTPKLKSAIKRAGQVVAERFALTGIFGVDCIVRDDTPWPVEVNPRYTASVEVLERALGIRCLTLHAKCYGWPPHPQPLSLRARGVLAVPPHPRSPHPQPLSPRRDDSVQATSHGRGERGAEPSIHREAEPPSPREAKRPIACEAERPITCEQGASNKSVHGKAILFARRDFVFPAEGPWLSSLRKPNFECGTDFADIPHPGMPIKAGRPVLTLFAAAGSIAECENLLREIAQDLDRRLCG